MTTPLVRCLDVGGTFIKCQDGRQVPTLSRGTREEIAAALRTAIGPVESLTQLGVAIPGPFDYQSGVFLMKHKFAAVYGESFRDLAGIPPTVDVRFMHDVNAVLAGSVEMLDLKDCTCALVTLGTGLGYSYAVDGVVQSNAQGSPARGLWNRPWGDGILEDQISARGISAAYASFSGEASVSARVVAQRAVDGDKEACRVFFELSDMLGRVLIEEADALGLDVVLLGGQISKSSALFMEPLAEWLPGVRVLPAPEGAVFRGLEGLWK